MFSDLIFSIFNLTCQILFQLWVVLAKGKGLLSQSALMPALELNSSFFFFFFKENEIDYANIFSLKYIKERSKFPVIYL